MAINAGGGGADAAQTVLWEWNGTDVSQLGDGVGGPTAVTSFGTATAAIAADTIVDAAPGGIDGSEDAPIIRCTHAGGAGTPGSFFMINDLPALPDRYVIEHRQGPREGAGLGLNTIPLLVWGYQDPTHYFSLSRGAGGLQFQIVAGNNADGLLNGAFVLVTGGVLNGDDGDYMRVYVDARDPTGSTDPGVKTLVEGRPAIAVQSIAFSTGGMTPFGTGTAPSAGWHASWRSGGTIKNVGVLFQEITAVAGEGYIGDLRILSWPGVG